MRSNFLIVNNDQPSLFNLRTKVKNKSKGEASDVFALKNNQILNVNNNKEIAADQIIFEPGSKICLFQGATLILESKNLLFEKSVKDGGVNIAGCDNKGGSLIIRKSNVIGNDIYANNLSSPNLKLMNLFGGLNIIESKIKVDNLYISNSQSEDSVNLVNSELKTSNLSFVNIKSDALDLDNSTFRAESIICENVGNDCLDLSNSIGKVNFFQSSYVKDKVISLGESSNLNVNNLNIFNSEIGAVSKDKSVLTINKFIYKEVKLPIVSFIKKTEFGSPIISITDIYPNKGNKYLISKDSFFIVDDKLIKGTKSSIQIKKMLYGNQYGVKTDR